MLYSPDSLTSPYGQPGSIPVSRPTIIPITITVEIASNSDGWSFVMARTCHGASERDLLLCAKGLLRRARPAAGGPDPIVKILHRKKFAIQLIACHTVAMECYRRAMNSQLPARDYHLNQANKLSRTYATLLESLNKHRGKGQQKVTVEHVHVHQGGQAIVGHIEHKGEGDGDRNGGSTPCKGG